MLSFTELGELDFSAFSAQFEDREAAEELLTSLRETSDAGCDDYAVCALGNLLLVRCFSEGEYFFLYPFAMGENVGIAEMTGAVSALTEYAMREEISMLFADVPEEDEEIFSAAGYRFPTRFGDGLNILLETELDRLETAPSASDGGVALSPLEKADIVDYARLCRDRETNRFWGYRAEEDFRAAPTDEMLFERAGEEWESRVALSLALRDAENGRFLGEAVLYAFDGKGGAECALRLLPEFCRRGFGKAALALLCQTAKSIGLLRLYAEIMPENLPSRALFAGWEACPAHENHLRFVREL